MGSRKPSPYPIWSPSSWLEAPFELYADIFRELTLPVCRQQEASADALACRVFGSQALVAALLATHNGVIGDIKDPERYAEIHQYDSHPPLRERIAAARRFPAGEQPAEDPPAVSLLSQD